MRLGTHIGPAVLALALAATACGGAHEGIRRDGQCRVGMQDTFDGSTDAWTWGYAHPFGYAPEFGSADSNGFLVVRSGGDQPVYQDNATKTQFSPKLGVFNAQQWQCDFPAAGIRAIRVRARIIDSAEDIVLRLVLQHGLVAPRKGREPNPELGITQWSSLSSLEIPKNDRGWHTGVFPLEASDYKRVDGELPFAEVVADTTKMFFRHQSSYADNAQPQNIEATIAIDDVTGCGTADCSS